MIMIKKELKSIMTFLYTRIYNIDRIKIFTYVKTE